MHQRISKRNRSYGSTNLRPFTRETSFGIWDRFLRQRWERQRAAWRRASGTGGGPKGPQPGDGPRQPWILVHADEIDLDKNKQDLVAIFTQPYDKFISADAGAKVCVSSWRRVDDTAIPARGKINGAYANGALVKSEAMLNGFDDAIVLNQNGHVSEGSVANLVKEARAR